MPAGLRGGSGLDLLLGYLPPGPAVRVWQAEDQRRQHYVPGCFHGPAGPCGGCVCLPLFYLFLFTFATSSSSPSSSSFIPSSAARYYLTVCVHYTCTQWPPPPSPCSLYFKPALYHLNLAYHHLTSISQGWNLRSFACGNTTFAVAGEDAAVTWGQGAGQGELGYGPTGPKSSANPKKVETLSEKHCIQVACGVGHTLFLMDPKVGQLPNNIISTAKLRKFAQTCANLRKLAQTCANLRKLPQT